MHKGNSWSSHHQQQQYHQPAEYTAGADIKQLAEYSASIYAQTPEEHASYVQYYTIYYQQQAQVTPPPLFYPHIIPWLTYLHVCVVYAFKNINEHFVKSPKKM